MERHEKSVLARTGWRWACGVSGLPGPISAAELASWLAETSWASKGRLCGGTNADFRQATYAVTDVKGGFRCCTSRQETVSSRHYRGAGGQFPTELPLDPGPDQTNDGRRDVGKAEVMNPVAPVLADGLSCTTPRRISHSRPTSPC